MSTHLPIYKPPATRGDCLEGGSNAQRPCTRRRCWWHLSHTGYRGPGSNASRRDKIVFRDMEGAAETCALDVADAGDHTLLQIANFMGVSRERVRQIEALAMNRFALSDFSLIDHVAEPRPKIPDPMLRSLGGRDNAGLLIAAIDYQGEVRD